MPVASPTAAATAPARFGGSRTTSVIAARRASAPRRPSRSATVAGPAVPGSRDGRSTTIRSTVRLDSSAPAIAIPSSASAGVTTTSHSGRMPRATASTGSNAAARSSQATIAPAAWASATSRRASVVRPLERSPRSSTPIPRGTPPGPRIASSAANPVDNTRARSGSACGARTAGTGTVASAPTTSVQRVGAAAPQRERSVARASLTSARSVVTQPLSNGCSNESTPWFPMDTETTTSRPRSCSGPERWSVCSRRRPWRHRSGRGKACGARVRQNRSTRFTSRTNRPGNRRPSRDHRRTSSLA